MWYYTFPWNVDFLSKGLVEKHVLVIRIYYICSDQMYNPCIDEWDIWKQWTWFLRAILLQGRLELVVRCLVPHTMITKMGDQSPVKSRCWLDWAGNIRLLCQAAVIVLGSVELVLENGPAGGWHWVSDTLFTVTIYMSGGRVFLWLLGIKLGSRK